ncbi:MAG: DNA mismatch repair protein MutS [Defluviitaleaceae bacterium]|nr:DNA mismatch repair protein MutS [Defluviitaleaceae bacterium]
MAKYSPMMEQYLQIKAVNSDSFLFFRLGDFYEMFFEDAVKASEILGLVLTGRECGQKERVPMCGIPFHAADTYIAKLVENGHKVAICEQVEEASKTKSLVKREVVRIITPGTVTDGKILDDTANNYIMSLFYSIEGIGLAFCDVTTGEFFTTQIENDFSNEVIDEIARIKPKELIVNKVPDNQKSIEQLFNIKPFEYYSWNFEYSTAAKNICTHFKIHNINSFGLEGRGVAVSASGALLQYLKETQRNDLSHINLIKYYGKNKFMSLDASSRRHLELTESIRDRSKKGTLLWVLDKTKTSMGGRLLRKWIEQPLIDSDDIKRRLDTVSELKDSMYVRNDIRDTLSIIGDIERLMGKIIYRSASGRDLTSLKLSLLQIPEIKRFISECNSKLTKEMYEALDTLEDIYELIENSIDEHAPANLKDGNMIKSGYNQELDRYKNARNKGAVWLLEKEAEERKATGIKSLKIKYNKIFGYFIEVTNSNINLVPSNYIRRQTMANGERYTTIELKEIEDAILEAEEKILELENMLYLEILEKIANEVHRIQLTAQIISTIDVFQSLAESADNYNYAKPEITNGDEINIKDGRHPVLETISGISFVPNDVFLDESDDRLLIITGPNMAGKSTYMRQTALIILMAQIGSFIPAESGVIGVVDKIFTRVGASDDLSIGQSTFMVEMSEVANIINTSTKNSLLILDEIGRGTSTFDGLSIAWSVLEYICSQIGARTLFSTHYHELSELEGKISGVKNYRMLIREQGEDIIFLRKIARGGADNSYGLHVAKLAGLPKSILSRADEILSSLNHADIASSRKKIESRKDVVYGQDKDKELSQEYVIIKEIMELDIDAITPRDALRKLFDYQNMSKGFGKA